MLQLLESIEVMLQNGNSIHPNSVIRGAIRIAIGMDQYGMPEGLDTAEKHEQYLKDIGLKKQTAVEWLNEQMNNIKGSSISMNGRVQFIEKELNNLLEQAKAMERSQKAEEYLKGFKDGKEYQIKLDELTFKSE